MAENDRPGTGANVDPSEGENPSASASPQGQEEGGGQQGRGDEQKKDEPSLSGKGINPVQHSE